MLFKRILPLVIFIIFIATGFILLFGYRALNNSVPEERGRFTLSGLTAPVKIWRDTWSVPHIAAQNEADLFYAAAYASAQDRLWQMDLLRRAGQGKLAEIFGAEALPVDILARTLALSDIAAQLYQQLPEDSKAVLQSYTAGVNAFIKSDQKRSLEFSVLRYTPEPWRPEDSLVILRLLSWMLSMGWHIDPLYGELHAVLPQDKWLGILPDGVPPPTPPLSTLAPAAAILREGSACLQKYLGFVPTGLGSNAWVLSGLRTQSGKPLLANDTHLPFTAPAIFYLMHLDAGSVRSIGASFPGIPGIIAGRNTDIAWGITNAMVDDIDFLHIKLDPADSSHYLEGGLSLALQSRQEIIRVRNAENFQLTVQSTLHGPLIPRQNEIWQGAVRGPVCIKWVGFTPSDEITAILAMQKAHTWTEFTSAMHFSAVPGENYIYADRAGNIGYQLAADIPVRSYSDPLIPVPDSMRGDWTGQVPFNQLPQAYNPVSGLLANANNKVAHPQYSDYLSCYWEPGYRVDRIRALLDSLSSATVQDFRRMQMDCYDGQAALLLPVFLDSLQDVHPQEETPAHYALQLLQNWNYQEQPESLGSTLYAEMYLQLQRFTFADEMGPDLFARFLQLPRINMSVLDRLILKADTTWFDDISTKQQKENLKDVIEKSFFAAVDTLVQRFGDDIGQWHWSKSHKLIIRHPLGMRASLALFFNIGPLETCGGNFTLNNATYLPAKPEAVIIGPCFRQIVDLSTQDYYAVLLTGQSGHPFSAHYKDQTALWRCGELIKFSLDLPVLPPSDWKLCELIPLNP